MSNKFINGCTNKLEGVRNQAFPFLFYLSIAYGIARDYQSAIQRFDGANGRFVLHQQILDGVAESPYRYRILVPNVLNIFIERDSTGAVNPQSFDLVYFTFFLLFLTLTFLCISMTVEKFVSRQVSVFSPLILALALPYGLRDHGFQPWSVLELFLISLSMFLLSRGSKNWLLLLTCLFATLNRETAFLIPGLALSPILYDFIKSKKIFFNRLLGPSFVFSVWLVTYLVLRVSLGNANHVDTNLIHNLNHGPGRLRLAIENIIVIIGPLLILVFKSMSESLRAKQLILSIIPTMFAYLFSVYKFGVWAEVRLLLPVFPVLIPLAVVTLSKNSEGSLFSQQLNRD